MNKEDLQALRNAYAIAVEDNRILKDRLDKIKEIAKENNICDGFGCIPMYKILKVIEGAEE